MGQGFIGAAVVLTYGVFSFFFSRRKRRNEPVWPSKKMYNGFVGIACLGVFLGVALMVWDIVTATATQWEGFYQGTLTRGTLYFEAVLGIASSAICTIGLLLV